MAIANARALLRRLVPSRLWAWRQQRLVARIRAKNRGRSTREIFSEIYETAQWGGKRGEFNSGRGSEPSVTAAYCALIREFIDEHRVGSVVDLGCGDFEVGKRIVRGDLSYTGVNVVAPLIERNRRLYGNDTLRFECLDIVDEALPVADLCLVRQVFQHLSNRQIVSVLGKLDAFAHVIVTEHYPAKPESCVPNLDKPAGPDTRVVDGSGVFLDRPPFNRAVRLLLSSSAPSTVRSGETLRSYLLYPEVAAGR